MNQTTTASIELPVTRLRGVGPKRADKLAHLGIYSIQDLLFHLPLRYQDRTRIYPIGSLRPGAQVVIEGEIDHSEIRFGRRRSLLVHLNDGSGGLILRFFYFNAAQKNSLIRGVRIRCFGEVRNGPSSLEMVHPEYEMHKADEDAPQQQTLTPIYPTTEGLHQLTWRDLTDQGLELIAREGMRLVEWLPSELCHRFELPELQQAVRFLHRPPQGTRPEQLLDGNHPAQQRLAFEELLAHQLSMRAMRQKHQQSAAPVLSGTGVLQQQLAAGLGFDLTAAQQRVSAEIAADLGLNIPMLRMVQGDVGCGKTVVAALAALQSVESGHQVALMSPTELLAEQHLKTFQAWLRPLNINVGRLTGKQSAADRRDILAGLADGSVQVVVGTHALFQDQVHFHALGLAIIDEQHRFGVHQRLALRERGRNAGGIPHQLVMTATPIPRSLAMTAYADLDLSIIDELPPGRKPVQTLVISDQRRPEIVQRVRAACAEGRQAYWVCTLIEESEVLQCQAAEEAAISLTEALPDLKVALVHGRMKSAEKTAVMADFKAGLFDLLVATTVIEVGVDVPRASLMIIENPERLGLSQLHQLRGRVGRGTVQSHCVLMYHPPLGANSRARLAILRETNDGFKVARKDLELRGPGEVLGTRQTGEMQFRIADLIRDQELLPKVQQAADWILQHAPDSVSPLVSRWTGNNTRYARV